MPIDAKHPSYDDFMDDWEKLRDCYIGEKVIKRKGQIYLKPTTSMFLDGMTSSKDIGFQNYENYKLRAVWHDLFKEAVEAYIGLLNYKPPQITAPEKVMAVRSNQGETIEQLMRRVHEEQLITGRLGLLTDMPLNPDPSNPLPYIAMYSAEAVRNWDTGEGADNQTHLQFVILNESGYARTSQDAFDWTEETRYRVCMLGSNLVSPGDYHTGLFKVTGTGAPTFESSGMRTPMLRGNVLKEIPFTFVNSKDLLALPDSAPLLGLANMMLSIYRGEADYRQNLFMQGQDTLVLIGAVQNKDATSAEELPLRTGAGARIEIEQGGDAKYVGVESAGLPEQRTAIANDRQRAEVRAGQLVNARVGDKESGEALKTRLAGQTATLKQIALTSGAAIEAQLKHAARWMGEDDSKIKVEPNEEFTSTSATGQDLNQMMDAKDKGAPISYESLHAWMADRGITKKSFKEEFETIVKERTMVQVLMNPVALEQKDKELDNQDPKNKPPVAPAKPPAQ